MKEQYKVYLDGSSDSSIVATEKAKEAACMYYNNLIMTGKVGLNLFDSERVVVEHPRGPEIDKTVEWHTEDEETFTLFDVSVSSINIDVESV